jgi:hypothetical protein
MLLAARDLVAHEDKPADDTGVDEVARKFAYSKAVFTLLQSYLSLSGTTHPLLEKEEERLQKYGMKLQKAESRRILSAQKMTLDISAVNRFITHAIPDLSQQQRADLKALEKRLKQDEEHRMVKDKRGC